jgi:hypothetical protein
MKLRASLSLRARQSSLLSFLIFCARRDFLIYRFLRYLAGQFIFPAVFEIYFFEVNSKPGRDGAV